MKIIKWTVAVLAACYVGLVVIAYLPRESTPVTEFTGSHSRFITVNGNAVHYTKRGGGPPLVLVHGFAGSTYTWRDLAPLLLDDYTVYALDLLGFGLTDKPSDGGYDMASQAGLLLGFMRAVGLSRATLIGHSMGGVVVAFAAVKAPSMVDRLVIVEGGFYHGGAPPFLKYLVFPLKRIMGRVFYTASFRAKSLRASYHDKSMVTDELIENYLLPGKTPNAADAMAAMMAGDQPPTYAGVSTPITRPTLLVWSRFNTHNPVADGQRLQKEIKNSKLVIIDGCSHYVQEEKPEKLAAAIKSFLTVTTTGK